MTAIKDSICWYCENAVPSKDGTRGCSWSSKLIPVEGWTTYEYSASAGKAGKKTIRHVVRTCPLFNGTIPQQKTGSGRKGVRCLDDGRTFKSLSDAARFYNIPCCSSITKCCSGKCVTAHGLRFKWWDSVE